MFVRQPAGCPPDPVFPETLKAHGVCIDENDQIRMIGNPKEHVKLRTSKNDRYNRLRMESIKTLLVNEISERLHDVGVQKLYLPQLKALQPLKEQCLPIYVTKLQELKQKDRVVVLIPDGIQEPEVLNFQAMMNEEGLEKASLLHIVKSIEHEGDKAPGLVVLNTSQLLYSYTLGRALSLSGWNNRKRKSMIHPPQVILDQYNKIPGHGTAEDHISWVFDNVLGNENFIKPAAKLDIIAIRQGGTDLLAYLGQTFDKYSDRISSIAMIHCFYPDDGIQNMNVNLRAFLATRARSWILSKEETNKQILDDLEEINGGSVCPAFSGGEEFISDRIIIRALRPILKWFEEQN